VSWKSLHWNPLRTPPDVESYVRTLTDHLDRLFEIIYEDAVQLAEDLGPESHDVLQPLYVALDEIGAASDSAETFWKVYQNEWTGGYTEDMAMGWGEGSEGEAANSVQHPALNGDQFKPDKSAGKDLSVHEHALRVNRLLDTYAAATPQERSAGRTWYRNAHRAAVTVASGRNPGVIPYGKKDTPSIKQGVYRPPGVTQEHVTRAAGVIARLSPSMPAGMDYEHNPKAAHELYQMTPKQRETASGTSPAASAARRVRGNVGLPHSGGMHIGHATAILEGHETAEENLNQKIGRRGDRLDVRKKAGSFMRNIASPATSHEVTVDARSAGIAAHYRVGFAEVAQDLGNLTGTTTMRQPTRRLRTSRASVRADRLWVTSSRPPRG
jgi:hypothetical protein